jgi:hypothetical protein
LFNFFLNDLIKNCINLEIGAKVGEQNLSIIAFCDDVLLMSPSEAHLNRLLNECKNYAKTWKIEFNAKKSETITVGKDKRRPVFKMDDKIIPNVDGLVYLGLPIGNQQFVEDFFNQKFSKVERSMYSLRGLGCKPLHLNPFSVGYIYKQYCQSQFKYGLENTFISQSCLHALEIRQNILVKQAIGLGKYCRTKALFASLRIESISQMYQKHKIFFLKQINQNSLVNRLFEYLRTYYEENNITIPKSSYIRQIKNIESMTQIPCSAKDARLILQAIDTKLACSNRGLIDTLRFHYHRMSTVTDINDAKEILNDIKSYLFVNFYENSN